MKKLGVRDTRFPGAMEGPEHLEEYKEREGTEQILLHNPFYEMFKGKVALSKLTKILSTNHQ